MSYDDTNIDRIGGHVIYKVMPALLSNLCNKGVINPDGSFTREELWDIVHTNSEVVSELYGVTEIYPDIVESAKLLFNNDDRYSCLILIATTIEHIINKYLREILPYYDFSQDNITNIIRTTNIDGKLGWLFKLISGTDVPSDLKFQINEIIQARNRLIHYKYIRKSIDEPDYLSDIKAFLSRIDFEYLSEIPQELEEYLQYSLEMKDPSISKIYEMRNIMFGFPKDTRIKNYEEFLQMYDKYNN
jgi:hypothetical protein